jgi:predicted Mrr-cat superfamily restriction endonuclease
MGWQDIEPSIATHASFDELWKEMREVYSDKPDGTISMWTGQLYRFAQVCSGGDYVLYYDPPRKTVRICRVTSDPFYRDFETDVELDVWHCRQVEYPVEPILIVDFYGPLKGRLLGPRLGF